MSPDGRTVAAFVDSYGLRLIDVNAGSATPPVYPDLGPQSQFQVLGWNPTGVMWLSHHSSSTPSARIS